MFIDDLNKMPAQAISCVAVYMRIDKTYNYLSTVTTVVATEREAEEFFTNTCKEFAVIWKQKTIVPLPQDTTKLKLHAAKALEAQLKRMRAEHHVEEQALVEHINSLLALEGPQTLDGELE